jgi:hypothetical protein
MNILDHFVSPDREGAAVEVVLLASDNPCLWAARMATLRIRCAWVRRRLRASGAAGTRSFAFYPTLESPSIVYELAIPARRYAESSLLPGGGRVPPTVRRILATVAGCDPGVSAVVVLGCRR